MNDTVTQQQHIRDDVTTACRTLVLQMNTCTINFILLNNFLIPRSVLIIFVTITYLVNLQRNRNIISSDKMFTHCESQRLSVCYYKQ